MGLGLRRRLKRIIAAAVEPELPTHHAALSALAHGGSTREWAQLAMYAEVLLQIRGVPGDILEFGVSSGTSLKALARLVEAFNVYRHEVAHRRVIGFDSFEGLPALTEADQASEGWKQLRDMTPGGYDGSQHLADLVAFQEQYSFVTLERGWFSESVPRYLARHEHTAVALLHIDCDLYESTKDALVPFISRIPPGGVVLFDEIFHPNFPGETKAFWETFSGLQGDGRFEFVRVGAMPWKWYLKRQA